MVLLALFGCHHEDTVAIPEKPAIDAPVPYQPTADEAAMIQQLSSKDAAPACADVEALSAQPVVALQHIVDRVARPPTVPMRAADCLVTGHAAEVAPTLRAWVVDPEKKGLALLVFDRIDALPPELALAVATDAMAGPNRDVAAPRLQKSANPAIRAVGAP